MVCGEPYKEGVKISSENLTTNELISFGITTFDNLAVSILTIFVNITLEGWTLMMYNLMDSSQAWLAILFFCLMVILGAFFLLQVILAIIMQAFDEVDQV